MEIGFLGRESSTVAAFQACPTLWYPSLYNDDDDDEEEEDDDVDIYGDNDDDEGKEVPAGDNL